MLSLNALDYILVTIAVVSVIIGVVRGFVREALSLITWIVAVWIAARYGSLVMPVFAKLVSSAGLRLWVARGAVFLGILVLGALINWIFARLIHTAGLTGTDRLIGMLFGAARGALLIGASVWLLRTAGMEQEPWWRESKLIPYAAPAADAAWAAAKRGLEQLQAQKRALAAANSQIRV